MPEELTSTANFDNNEWTITSAEFPEIHTVGLWLGDTLAAHRKQLRRHSTADVQVTYRIGGRDIDGDVKQVREAVEWLHETYRVAKTFDVTTRPDRYALLEKLTEWQVMPSEMALMLGVELRIAERFAGDDRESRIARQLLHQMSTTSEGIRA